MRAIVLGPDRGLADALEAEGVDTVRLQGLGTADVLSEAGVADADLYVLTDVSEATSVSVVKDLNPDVRVVVYSPDTIPEYARGQVDFAIAPGALPAAAVAEELTAA